MLRRIDILLKAVLKVYFETNVLDKYSFSANILKPQINFFSDNSTLFVLKTNLKKLLIINRDFTNVIYMTYGLK